MSKNATVDLTIQGHDEFTPHSTRAIEALDDLAQESNKTKAELQELQSAQRKLSSAKELDKYAEATAQSLAEAKQSVKALNDEIQRSGKPTRDQAEALRLAKRSATAAQKEYDKARASLVKNSAALAAAGVDTRNLAKEEAKLNAQSQVLKQTRQAQREQYKALTAELNHNAKSTEKLKDKNKQLTKSLDQADKASQGFNTGLNNITKGLIAAGATYIGIDTLKSSVLDLLNTGGRFEKLDKQMQSIMGSIEQGERASAWVQDFAKNTPYQLDGVTEAFVKMKAFGLDPMDGSMQAITDQVAKLGGDQEMLEGTVLAVGQAWAKQKLQGEEILQLIERGIPVWELLEKATGKNTLELQKMSSAGQLGRKEIKLLMDEMAKGATGSAKAMMDTWNGLASNLQDNVDKLKNTIAKAGLLDYFKTELTQLNGLIDEMAADGRLEEYAAQISSAITGTIDALKVGVSTIYEYRTEIGTLITLVAGFKLASMFGGFAQSAAGAISSLKQYHAELRNTKKSAVNLKALGAGMFGPLALSATLATPALTALYKEMMNYDEVLKAASDSEILKRETTKALNETLAKYSEQVGIQLKDAEHLAKLERDGVVAWDDKAKAYYNVAAAAKEKAAAEQDALAKANPLFAATIEHTKAVKEQVEAINQAAAQSSLSKWADDYFKAFKPENVAQVVALGTTLDEITDKNAKLGASLETELIERLTRLTSTELVQFQASIQSAFESGLLSVTDHSQQMELVLKASFKQLGLDMEVVNNQITATGSVAIAAFENISTSGTQSFDAVRTAFDAAIGQAKTKAELDALLVLWQDYVKKHNIAADDAAAGVKRIEDAQRSLINNTSEVEKAFQQLGLQSVATLQDIAQKNKDAYFVLKESGVASVEVLTKAHGVWKNSAEAVAEATGKQVDPIVDVEGAAYDLSDQLGKLTKAQDDTAASSRNLASDVGNTATAMEDAATRTENASRRIIDANARTREQEIANRVNEAEGGAGSTLGTGVDTSNLGGKSLRELEEMKAELARNMTKTGLSRGFNNGAAVDALLKQMKAQMDELREAIRKAKEAEKNNRDNSANRNTSSGANDGGFKRILDDYKLKNHLLEKEIQRLEEIIKASKSNSASSSQSNQPAQTLVLQIGTGRYPVSASPNVLRNLNNEITRLKGLS